MSRPRWDYLLSELVALCETDEAARLANQIEREVNAALRQPRADDESVERVGKSICAEKCAYMGEPPCWSFTEESWPPPTCDEPGCVAEARAAIGAMHE